MKRALVIIGVIAVLAVGAAFGGRAWRHFERPQNQNVPVELNVAIGNANANVNTPLDNANAATGSDDNVNINLGPLPAEINLSAPFTSQAPLVNWDAEHEEFCEEASILMAARALQGRGIKDANDAETALQQIKDWEMEKFGYFESTTAIETARIIREFYGLTATLLNNPTVEQLKRELANEHFVIVPAAGRELHNPNFKQPGPIYHMLLLKGYTARGEFVTNDPGTRNGRNYVYRESVLMAAIHDWKGEDTANGRSVVIIISR
jgi:hypothetical protein